MSIASQSSTRPERRSGRTIRSRLPYGPCWAGKGKRETGNASSSATCRRASWSRTLRGRTTGRATLSSEGPPQQWHGEKRQRIEDAVPGGARRADEIPVSPLVRHAHGGDRDHARHGGRAQGREQRREHPAHDDVLHEPERANPGRQHRLSQSPLVSRRGATAAPGVLFFPTMCGIVGYTGPRQAAALLLEGLKRLEYRGYDSAGLALVHDGRIEVHKAAGKISVL